MREVKKFPGWRWDPETGEGRIFNSAEEVPEGWLDRHPNSEDAAKPPPPPSPLKPVPMERKDVIAALQQGGVKYKVSQSTAALYDLLCESLRIFLTERNITVPPDADAKALLEVASKVTKPQE